MLWRTATVLILLASAAGLAVCAQGEEPHGGPLAALPSQPGPHIEKIDALGDNQWLNLGTPAADPQWTDPALNAYFCHLAGDSSDNGVVWVYRYKQRDWRRERAGS